MSVHVFPNCSCESFALFMAEDTSSRSYCVLFFFARIKFLSQKGFPLKKKKKFYDKTMFIYLRTCIHMYTNIHTCIITVFFLAILKKKYFSWQRTPPAIVIVFLFFLKKKKTREKNRVFAYIFFWLWLQGSRS